MAISMTCECSSLNIFRMVQTKMTERAVVRQSLRRRKNVRSSAGIQEEKRTLSNRNSDIKVNFEVTQWDVVGWVYVVQDVNKWRNLFKIIRTEPPCFIKCRGNSLRADGRYTLMQETGTVPETSH
jgi:hypothetical protein